jgi:DNA-binding XRE family transcriptional regulator
MPDTHDPTEISSATANIVSAFTALATAERRAENPELFDNLANAIEDLEEELAGLLAYSRHQENAKAGRDLAMPRHQWARIRAGEAAVRVVREYRGLTQADLAEASGVARPEISAIETGARRGTVDTFKALAKALRAPMDVLVGD